MNGLDMTSGKIASKLFKLAMPLLVTNLINMAYNLTDIFWLGNIGHEAVSAVGSMGLFMWLGMSFGALAKTGTEVMVSQEYGKKNLSGVNKYATNGLFLAICIGVIYGLSIFLLKDTIIQIFDFDSSELKNYAMDYLKFMPFCALFLIINHQFISTYNGMGNTKLVFTFVSLGLAINMILDPLFIIKLNMGSKGAAIATMIAIMTLSATFAIYSKFKADVYKNFTLNLSLKKCLRLLNLGVLPMTQQVFFALIFITTNIFIVTYGDVNVAICAIGSQIESLTWIVGAAATTAMTVFTGQNYGVNNFKRIAKGFSLVSCIMMSYSLVVTLSFMFFGKEIFSIFLQNDNSTAALGATYLLINAPAQLFMMFEGIATGFFNGQGHTKVPAFASIFGNVIRIPLIIFLGNIYGINGVWIAMSISATSKGFILIIQFVISVIRNKNLKFSDFNLINGGSYVKCS